MFNASVLDIKTVSLVFEGLVEYAVLPGEEGELSILNFHQSIIAKLKSGVVKTDKKWVPIKRGIAKMQNNELVVLAEIKERKEKPEDKG